MGRFDLNLNDLIEGQVIKKSTLTGVYGQLNASLDDGIGPENIREEGLDRRSFGNAMSFRSAERCSLSSMDILQVPNESGTHPSSFTKGPIDGLSGSHGEHPRVDFTWDPQTDTYAVVRCSFSVSQQRNERRYEKGSAVGGAAFSLTSNDAWDFGLYVAPKSGVDGFGIVETPRLAKNTKSVGGVFVYQRMCLNPAFSYLGDNVDTGLRAEDGAPSRYGFDRISSMRQSFCMFVVFGVSNASSAYSESIVNLDEPTTVSVELCWRARNGKYSYLVDDHPISDGVATTATKMNSVELDNLSMNVTKYRR